MTFGTSGEIHRGMENKASTVAQESLTSVPAKPQG